MVQRDREISDTEPPAYPPAIAPQLGLADAVSIIVGITVGTAIFRSSDAVFQNTAGPWQAQGVWLLGGVLSLCGAWCYAELATAYPRDGGDYEYLSRAFGPWAGFLFGWGQWTAILSGNIGAMAYAFADYAAAVWPTVSHQAAGLAVVAIVVLSACNMLGVVAGKSVQNLLSVTKVVGLGAVILAGLWGGVKPQAEVQPVDGANVNLGLALVFVLFAYGGWNNAAFVAAEVRDQRRNLPRALWIGIGAVTAIYLAVNAAYLAVLGFDGARHAATPAADVLEHVVGAWGSRLVSVLVMISALGAINGMILTGSRVYATWGEDYRALGWLAAWDRHRGAPIAAIVAQAASAIGLVLLVGTERGQQFFDAMLGIVGLAGMSWDQYSGGFESLVVATAPVFWLFFLATGVASMVLRWRDPAAERPFRIPLYPVPPLVFCGTCGYMIWASVAYARWLTLMGLAPLAVGVPLYFLARRR